MGLDSRAGAQEIRGNKLRMKRRIGGNQKKTWTLGALREANTEVRKQQTSVRLIGRGFLYLGTKLDVAVRLKQESWRRHA